MVLHVTSLRRQPNAAKQIGEPRICTKSVESRINFEPKESGGPIPVGFFKTLERQIVITKGRVNCRYPYRGDVLSLR